MREGDPLPNALPAWPVRHAWAGRKLALKRWTRWSKKPVILLPTHVLGFYVHVNTFLSYCIETMITKL